MNAAKALCPVAALLVVAGCGPKPPPSNARGPRIDPTLTTPGEAGAREILPVGWIEFADSATQQLVGDLSRLPEFKGDYRVTVIFGDIVNKTRVVSSDEFEQFRANFRNALTNSRTFSDLAVFRVERSRMDSVREREFGREEDLLQEGGRSSGLKPVNQDYSYFLNGEMYATHRADSALYSLTLMLVSVNSGEVIWTNQPYNFKQAAVR